MNPAGRLARAAGSIVLLAAVLSLPRVLPGPREPAHLRSLLLAVAGLALLASRGAGPARAVAAAISGLAALALVHPDRDPLAAVGLAISAAYLLVDEPRRVVPALLAWVTYAVLDFAELSWAWSVPLTDALEPATAAFSRWTGGRFTVGGVSALGLWAWACAIPAAAWMLSRSRRGLRPAHLLLLLAPVGGAVAQGFIGSDLVSPILALACLMVLPSGEESLPARRAGIAAVLAGLALAVVAWWGSRPPVSAPEPRAILLHEEGAFELDGGGSPSLARFEMYLRRLRAPYRRVSGPIRDDTLSDAGVLIVVTPMRDYAGAEVDSVRSFVREGGTLLVFGDHTNMFGTRDRIHRLLADTGLALHDDTAIPFRPGWIWGDAVSPPGRMRASLGASVSVSRPARPMAVAADGFSDRADPSNAAVLFLGNEEYERGVERRGEIVLAGEQALGAGRVILFGDTALLQDSAFSESWPYIDRLLAHALTPGARPRGPAAGVALALLAATALGATALLGRGAVASLAASFAVMSAALGAAERPWEPLLATGEGVAFVERSHGALCSREFSGSDGLSRMESHLEAEGLLPLALWPEAHGRVPRPQVLVVPPLAKPLPREESDRVAGWMAEGTIVVVSLSPATASAVEPVLSDADVEIEGTPFGPAHEARSEHTTEPPVFQEAWPLRVGGEGTEVVVEAWGRPLVVRRPVGDGAVAVIADPRFLLNSGMGIEWPIEANRQLLTALLRR